MYCFVQKDGAMKQIDTHAYGPRALATGASISPEQAVGEALTALAEGRVSTLGRADMSGALEDRKSAVVETIRARLAPSQPAH